jgi:hypothetical protein
MESFQAFKDGDTRRCSHCRVTLMFSNCYPRLTERGGEYGSYSAVSSTWSPQAKAQLRRERGPLPHSA